MGYKQPSRINAVSILVIGALVAAAYGALMFGPAYWRKYKVKEILDQSAHAMYPRRRGGGDDQAQFRDQLRDRTIAQIRAAGVADKDIRVNVAVLSDRIRVEADYNEIISHPLVGKQTVLHFAPTVDLPFTN